MFLRRKEKKDDMRNTNTRKKLPIRINVVILVGLGYFTLLVMFIAMAWGGMTVEEAYEVVKGPFMALIGGSLAISKDLLDNPSSTPAKPINDHPNNEDQRGDNEPAPQKPLDE